MRNKKRPTFEGYICRTGTTIEPFCEDASDSLIANEPLIETQKRAIRRAGGTPRQVRAPSELGPGPAVILFDRVYVSDKLMKDFVKAVDPAAPAMLGLARCISVEFNLPIQDVVIEDSGVFYSCFWVPDASRYAGEPDFLALESRLKADAGRVVVKMRELSASLRLPSLARQSRVFKFPITSSVAAHVVHWVTLLRLNSLQWGVRWLEYMRGDALGMAQKTVGALASAATVNPYRLMSKINVVGPDCEIHPSAYVEASFLGRGVKIGAGATVRNSFLGDGAVVGDAAYSMSSVLGAESYLTEGTALIWTVVYPGSSVGNVKIQMSMIGRDTYVGMWCSFLDAKFIGDIMVGHRGGLVSAGTSFLGSCVGNNCVMGGKVLIMPGRAIPNGTFMVMRPDECIVEIPEQLPAGVPLIRENGTLVALRKA
ncbi:MAG: hypothetical protein HY897_14360 [Deltaproteobacteria bacterium]|nr:hypothetical protein [Deltaproteobacteria bacterium]